MQGAIICRPPRMAEVQIMQGAKICQRHKPKVCTGLAVIPNVVRLSPLVFDWIIGSSPIMTGWGDGIQARPPLRRHSRPSHPVVIPAEAGIQSIIRSPLPRGQAPRSGTRPPRTAEVQIMQGAIICRPPRMVEVQIMQGAIICRPPRMVEVQIMQGAKICQHHKPKVCAGLAVMTITAYGIFTYRCYLFRFKIL